MDMSLPGMDGDEAARQLRADERTRAIPLVMISGYEPERIGAGEGLGPLPRQAVPDPNSWSA